MIDSVSPLKPGDIVVPLATLATQCGAISGAIAAGIALGRLKSSWSFALLGALGGAALGFCVGWAVGRLLFPAISGNVFVVRAGAAALPLTLRASLVASVLAGLGLSVGSAFFFGAAVWPSAVLSGAAVAIAVGLFFGLGAALV
jgi:hypothetical protein